MQRVYIVFHHLPEREIYHTVPCHGRLAGELRRHDFELVMPAAVACASVARMFMAVIGDLDLYGAQ